MPVASALGKDFLGTIQFTFILVDVATIVSIGGRLAGRKRDHEVIDEEEPEQDNSGLTMDCRPTSYKFALDSATYSYNVSNQVSKISIYYGRARGH